MLGKLPVPGGSYNLDMSRERAYCACSGCGWWLFGRFYSRLSVLSSFSLFLFVCLFVLLFYVHGKHLRSCRDGQLT